MNSGLQRLIACKSRGGDHAEAGRKLTFSIVLDLSYPIPCARLGQGSRSLVAKRPSCLVLPFFSFFVKGFVLLENPATSIIRE